MKHRAEKFLRLALENPSAEFRDGQWESIEQLLNRKRLLVVQRTGWGKSMVYFLATKLLRERGTGPTVLISPLLSLMRNQLDAARKIGVRACTINSTNTEEWDKIREDLELDRIDVLVISPERLSNDDFFKNIMSNITGNVGLFVVDEAHCISDWGHDFRPDYRRIVRILRILPHNVPVLATTATANDRVVRDIRSQLGDDIILQRGPLVRKSLSLQNIDMPSAAARMSWIAEKIPDLPGSGIVYTLTQRDAERLAEWLRFKGIDAEAYHAGLSNKIKEKLEMGLLKNEIKALIATVALGMGFDKPDLGFVIHFQRPASVVHYYQQVGRAGRSLDDAYGILLHGEEDDKIADFFIRSSFPPQSQVSKILKVLAEAENGLSTVEIQKFLNMRSNCIKKAIKFLTVESPAPIVKIDRKWRLTAAASSYKIDSSYVKTITDIRLKEQRQMDLYMKHRGCLMAFLQAALDDPNVERCGKCRNCNPSSMISDIYDENLANEASLFLRKSYQRISPRKKWPRGANISKEETAEEGRALSLWRDSGWGDMVAIGKYDAGRFSDELVFACMEMIRVWSPRPFPKWVTCVPSLNRPHLVPDFAARVANGLGVPFVPCVKKVRKNRQQKEMENSYHQVKNLDGVFIVSDLCRREECLLIDDVIDSGWTFTVISALLRRAGCSAVYPMALARNSSRMD
jgi:ATP-dependent DNA helicase RecQ